MIIIKKGFVIFSSCVILLIGLFLICEILNPGIFSEEFEMASTTTTSIKNVDEYSLLEERENYQKYQINTLEEVDIDLGNMTLSYNAKQIYIDDKLMVQDVLIYPYFALYSNSRLLVMYTYEDSFKSGIIFYNSMDKSTNVIEKIDNMYIKINDNTLINDLGFNIELSIVNDNKIYLNDTEKEICSFGYDNNLTVSKGIEYFYNYNIKALDRYEEIYSLSLESYVVNNKLCS